MGFWQLEVARMAMYVSFPIGMFHYFNHIENIEDWIIEQKRSYMPKDQPKKEADLREFIETYNIEKRKEALDRLEGQYKNKS